LKERPKKCQEYPLAFTLSKKEDMVCPISTETKPQLTLVETLAEDDNQEDKTNKEEQQEVKDRLLWTWTDIT